MTELYIKRHEVEREENWKERVEEMPYLRFHESWEVAVIPPWHGAMARFFVRRGESHVSVYADFDSALGYVGEPYWEIYPGVNLEDCNRFLLNETEELVAAIELSLRAQEARDD